MGKENPFSDSKNNKNGKFRTLRRLPYDDFKKDKDNSTETDNNYIIYELDEKV